MNVIFCDNHPDRRAVATIAIRNMPLGRRPLLVNMGPTTSGEFHDLCEECESNLRALVPKKEEKTNVH